VLDQVNQLEELTGTIRPGWPHPDGALGPLAARTADG
jgi:hypothetical protein